ncbi:hypothetical protein BH23PLA1_BH23PLA1_23440 [soil metagenome]
MLVYFNQVVSRVDRVVSNRSGLGPVMKAELVPENGDPPIPIIRDISVLGRRDYCDVRINHPSVSKRHCVLVRTAGLLVLRDLASTNGTKVKGQRIRWAALLPGDKVSFGNYKVRVYLGPDDALSPSEQTALHTLADDFPSPTPVESQDAQKTPSVDDSEILELDEEDFIGEDDGAWEKLSLNTSPEQRPFLIDIDLD